MSAGAYDIEIEQGVDRTIAITLKNKATGVALDVTGWTFQMQIREKYTSASVLYSPSINIVSAVNGQIEVVLTDTATAALPVKTLVYDLEATRPDTTRIRILKGACVVDPEVTR